MYTKTLICKMMLSRVGGEDIEDINEQSPNARECSLWYDQARLHTLSIFDWTFARRLKTLALSSFDPPADWAFSYLLPDDCVAARRVYNPALWYTCSTSVEGLLRAPRIPFAIQLGDDGVTKVLLTNMEDAKLLYTADQENTSLFSPEYVTNLVYLLGHFVGYKITGKTTIADKMLQLYMQFALPLQGNDANQGEEKPNIDSQFTLARY